MPISNPEVEAGDKAYGIFGCVSLNFWLAYSREFKFLEAMLTAIDLIARLGGWHREAHRALCSMATAIAARGISSFISAKSILFQRHAALLVTNNALCLMSGLVSAIRGGTYCSV